MIDGSMNNVVMHSKYMLLICWTVLYSGLFWTELLPDCFGGFLLACFFWRRRKPY